MDTNFKTQLENAGADVDTALNRFMGNEALYMKFLTKFEQDESFANIEKYVAEKNPEEIFKAAHTLKGVAANLGLDRIAQHASDLVEIFRNKAEFDDADTDRLEPIMENLRDTYQTLIQIITGNQ